MNRIKWYLIVVLSSLVASGYAQNNVSIQLTLVNKPTSTTQDAGLLIEVRNQTDQDIALFTPMGDLLRYINYYKWDALANQYLEIQHPYYQEIEREKKLKDSLFKASGILVHFSDEDYNWKSGLYRQFVQDDSLWFDYLVRHSQYEKSISHTDVQHFKDVMGIGQQPALFSLMKAKERFQNFMNITFLYQQQGDYKIVLSLPAIDLPSTCSVGGFLVKEPSVVVCNELYLSIR